MKRKIPALFFALLILFSAALPASAASGARGLCPRQWWDRLPVYRISDLFGAGSERSDAAAAPDGSGATDRADTPESSATVSDYAQQVTALVNAERAAYGLSPLTLNEALCVGAQRKAQDMHDQGYFSHTSPDYGSPFDMMRSLGITYQTAGENIAMGYSSPAAVVEAWMNSEGHRANILSSAYTAIGIGYVADGGYWTQWFIG